MRGNTLTIVAILLSATTFGGCASIVSGKSQTLIFQTSPEEAMVTIAGSVVGKTPATVNLEKKTDQIITFTKDGYKPVTMPLSTAVDNWFWGNILLGGLIGSTIDALSGAMHQYSPSQYFVTLTPEAGLSTDSATLKTQREKTREFIVRSYPNLMTDLTRGNGEDLTALMHMLNITDEKKADALRKMQALSEAFTDSRVFAD